jgi:CubicO group peptidase (beta-lactamase class C family)
LSSESVFEIASTSKQFTAASILLLVRRGIISLDDDIHKYFPKLPKYEAPITVSHLVHHISGIRDYVQLRGMADRNEEFFNNETANEHSFHFTTLCYCIAQTIQGGSIQASATAAALCLGSSLLESRIVLVEIIVAAMELLRNFVRVFPTIY